MKNHKKINLVMTCGACPEQYDAYFHDQPIHAIGYLRLRHGYFYAECHGEAVYGAHVQGDGIFEEFERGYHLKKARKAIYKRIKELGNAG